MKEAKPINQSKSMRMNMEDVKKIIRNAAIFLAPAFIVFLEVYQNTGSVQTASIALKVWGINTIIDIARKLIAGK